MRVIQFTRLLGWNIGLQESLLESLMGALEAKIIDSEYFKFVWGVKK